MTLASGFLPDRGFLEKSRSGAPPVNLICAAHPDAAAVARCVSCGHHLCGSCRHKLGVRNFCRACRDARTAPYGSRPKAAPAAAAAAAAGSRVATEQPVRTVRRKSPLLASVLSVVPGLGQFYAGRFVRGLVFFATAGALADAAFLTPMLAAFLWVFNLYDAFRLAENRNERTASGKVTERADDNLFSLVGLAVLAVSFLQSGGMQHGDPATAVPFLAVATGLWLAKQSRV